MSFHPDERRLLLATNGIGPGVLQRLEQAGYDSLRSIQDHGVDRVVSTIASQTSGKAWHNRRGALARALKAWASWPATAPNPERIARATTI